MDMKAHVSVHEDSKLEKKRKLFLTVKFQSTNKNYHSITSIEMIISTQSICKQQS